MGMPLRWKTSELLGSRRANAANRLLIGRLLAATAHASASRQSRSWLRQADRGHRRHDDCDGRPAHDVRPQRVAPRCVRSACDLSLRQAAPRSPTAAMAWAIACAAALVTPNRSTAA